MNIVKIRLLLRFSKAAVTWSFDSKNIVHLALSSICITSVINLIITSYKFVIKKINQSFRQLYCQVECVDDWIE